MERLYSVLIVDDMPENIKLAASILTGREYEIFFATSAQQAIEVLESSDIHLILLDVMMPEMNGYELCQKLRSEGKDLPIIFLTAMHDTDNIVKAFEVGGNDYIMKPFNELELLARVHNHATLYAYKKNLQLDLKHTMEENEIQKTVLLQREKMAQMGDAFSMIAHQWKQPLSTIASICTYIEMQEEFDSKLDEEMLGYIKSISAKVQHLSETVDVYKKFFKPAQEKEKVSIESIIEDALLIYKDLFLFNHVTVTTDFSSKPYAFAIPNEITQVILILLQNTLDELLAKKIQGMIKIGVAQSDDMVLIEIEDNAGGIPDAVIDHIFDINYTTKGAGGSGIGLYIAKTIIDNHHEGRLSVINKGDGAAFTLRIPVA